MCGFDICSLHSKSLKNHSLTDILQSITSLMPLPIFLSFLEKKVLGEQADFIIFFCLPLFLCQCFGEFILTDQDSCLLIFRTIHAYIYKKKQQKTVGVYSINSPLYLLPIPASLPSGTFANNSITKQMFMTFLAYYTHAHTAICVYVHALHIFAYLNSVHWVILEKSATFSFPPPNLS